MTESTSLHFTEEERKTLKAIHAPTATPIQWDFFLSECERRNLIPGTHVVFQLRKASEYEDGNKITVQKVTLITTINALRLLADRYSRKHPDMAYLGHGPFLYYYNTENGMTTGEEIPRGTQPHACSVELYRKDWKQPLKSVGRFEAYATYYGRGNERSLSAMWKTRSEEQLAKCTEANGLRAIAPEELGGLYISEEMDKELPEVTETAVAPAAPLPETLNTPAVNHAPAATTGQVVNPQPPVSTGVSSEVVVNSTEKVDKAEPKGLQSPEQPSLFPSEPPAETLAAAFGAPLHTQTPIDSFLAASRPSEPVAAAEPALPSSEQPVAPAVASTNGEPATKEEREKYIQRGKKIHRDMVQKTSYKGPAEDLKTYFLRVSGRQRVDRLAPAEWESALQALEFPALEEAVKILKGTANE